MKNIEYIVAGAGSGKTYRLTHRLAEYLASRNDGQEQLSPSEVIVTTFTRAAAAEVKSRAREVLHQSGQADKAAQLDAAAIGTVHSVAQQFLNKYWYVIGFTPDQDVITEEDKRIYRNQSLAGLLADHQYAKEQNAIQVFFDVFQPKKSDENNIPKDNPEFWAEYLSTLIDKMAYYEIADMAESRQHSAEAIDGVFSMDVSPDEETYKEIVARLISETNQHILSKSSGIKKLQQNLKKWRRLSSKMTYNNIVSIYGILSDEPKKGDWLSRRKADRNTVALWIRSKQYGKVVKDCIEALFTLAEAWQKEYENFKRLHGVIDYDDMEKGFLRLLDDETVRKEIGSTYKLLMVDEFQDSNPIQLKIFDKLSDIIAEHSPLTPSTVWVGDPKQAIYGFRGADTDLISRVDRRFPNDLHTPDDKGLRRDSLDTSYRSRPALVTKVNELFGREDFFPEMTLLKCDREENNDLPQAIQQWQFGEGSTGWREHLALQVKQFVESGKMVYDKDIQDLRPVRYSDIAILLRNNSQIGAMVEKFRREGVPASAPEKKILDRAEVQLVLSLLWLTEREGNPHELASVLRLWNDLSTEDVLTERMAYVASSPEIDEWLAGDARLEPIRTAIRHAKGLSIDKKIMLFVHELGLYDKVKKWGDENLRRQNLMTLQNAASQFVSRCARLELAPTMRQFVLYLNEAELKPVIDDEVNAVKVLTYHGSKGLEWPVVILGQLDDNSLEDDNLIKKEYFGVREVQNECHATNLFPSYHIQFFPTVVSSKCEVINNSGIMDTPMFLDIRKRMKSEAMRLLYVGMTRARDCLIVPMHKSMNPKWLHGIGLARSDFGESIVQLGTLDTAKSDELGSGRWSYTLNDLPALKDGRGDLRDCNPSRLTSGGAGMDYKRTDIREPIPTATQPAKDGTVVPVPFRHSVFGTCVHNVYAACPSVGAAPDEDERARFIDTATRIIRNYGLTTVLPDATPLCDSLYALYAWLTETYGPASRGILHEYPFICPMSDGHVMKGEMDLIWRAEDGDVIVDFKNYMGQPDDLLNPHSEYYVGKHYVHQLSAYRKILETPGSGFRVNGVLLYYNMLGTVIEMQS